MMTQSPTKPRRLPSTATPAHCEGETVYAHQPRALSQNLTRVAVSLASLVSQLVDPWLGRSPGEGKGYPLQYSGLENSMDRIVHGVTKRRTRLSDFHLLSFLILFKKLNSPPPHFFSWASSHSLRRLDLVLSQPDSYLTLPPQVLSPASARKEQTTRSSERFLMSSQPSLRVLI